MAGRPLLLLDATGEFSTRHLEPTPVEKPLGLEAWVEGRTGDTVAMCCTARCDETVTTRSEQTAVKLYGPAPIESELIDLHRPTAAR